MVNAVEACFPAEFDQFRRGAPQRLAAGPLDVAYYELLTQGDPAVYEKAANDWCDWEIAVMSLEGPPSPRWLDARFRLTFARIVTHYFSHNAWF